LRNSKAQGSAITPAEPELRQDASTVFIAVFMQLGTPL
jgi:hypothetical protein